MGHKTGHGGTTLRTFMARALTAATLLTWFIPRADAATLQGVTLPDTYPVDGQKLQLNGIGLRTATIFHVKIYVAGLYLPKPSHDANQILSSPSPKVVILHFIHSGTKAQVEKQYREGEEHNCGSGGCSPADQPDFERLVAAAPAVNPGDTSTFIFTAKGLRVLANDRLIGEYANPDLAYHFLAGFIGEHPPTQALRSQLLGLPDE
jgi:hypothetical protein